MKQTRTWRISSASSKRVSKSLSRLRLRTHSYSKKMTTFLLPARSLRKSQLRAIRHSQSASSRLSRLPSRLQTKPSLSLTSNSNHCSRRSLACRKSTTLSCRPCQTATNSSPTNSTRRKTVFCRKFRRCAMKSLPCSKLIRPVAHLRLMSTQSKSSAACNSLWAVLLSRWLKCRSKRKSRCLLQTRRSSKSFSRQIHPQQLNEDDWAQQLYVPRTCFEVSYL